MKELNNQELQTVAGGYYYEEVYYYDDPYFYGYRDPVDDMIAMAGIGAITGCFVGMINHGDLLEYTVIGGLIGLVVGAV